MQLTESVPQITAFLNGIESCVTVIVMNCFENSDPQPYILWLRVKFWHVVTVLYPVYLWLVSKTYCSFVEFKLKHFVIIINLIVFYVATDFLFQTKYYADQLPFYLMFK